VDAPALSGQRTDAAVLKMAELITFWPSLLELKRRLPKVWCPNCGTVQPLVEWRARGVASNGGKAVGRSSRDVACSFCASRPRQPPSREAGRVDWWPGLGCPKLNDQGAIRRPSRAD
jgi:hypothetical protein